MSALPRPARFCPYCATRLVRRDDHGMRRPTCPRCGYIAYQNPSPAVAVMVPGPRGLLFVRRKYPPYQGMWSLPSGFMEYGETPEQTARRETLEETGLRVRIEDLVGAYPGHDDPRVRVVLIVYRGRKTGGREQAGDDAAELKWFPADRPPRDLAFRAHRQAVRDYRRFLARA